MKRLYQEVGLEHWEENCLNLELIFRVYQIHIPKGIEPLKLKLL